MQDCLSLVPGQCAGNCQGRGRVGFELIFHMNKIFFMEFIIYIDEFLSKVLERRFEVEPLTAHGLFGPIDFLLCIHLFSQLEN